MVVGLIVLLALAAPTAVVGTAAVMLGWLLVMGPITLAWKISFHAGASAGAVVVLAHLLPWLPVLVAGVMVVTLIGWARVRVAHHTLGQVLAGVAAGGGVAWAVFAGLA
ncbi:hypothetical protein [Nonomuraea glycinis]|uniref:hypothetical protein n=1 Tax=Nonomuraea glycinis TaxID=2047744 RepID=UPI0033AC2E34